MNDIIHDDASITGWESYILVKQTTNPQYYRDRHAIRAKISIWTLPYLLIDGEILQNLTVARERTGV